MPRDRKGTFEPVIVKKRQRVLDDFSNIAISLYSKGNSTEDIKEILLNLYKINLSKSYISTLISKVTEDVISWQNRKLQSMYTFVYIDCLYTNVKYERVSKKVAIYVMIGISLEGKKEVVGIWMNQGGESSAFWCEIMEDIKYRGVEDILYISMDGLAGLEDAIEIVFPQTKTQRCVVHLVRNMYKLCNKKDAKEVISDYKKYSNLLQ